MVNGGSCSNSKPKYLQVSRLSFAGTLFLLGLLFCPFLEYHTPLTARLGLICREKRRQMSVMLDIVLQEVIIGNINKFVFRKPPLSWRSQELSELPEYKVNKLCFLQKSENLFINIREIWKMLTYILIILYQFYLLVVNYILINRTI